MEWEGEVAKDEPRKEEASKDRLGGEFRLVGVVGLEGIEWFEDTDLVSPRSASETARRMRTSEGVSGVGGARGEGGGGTPKTEVTEEFSVKGLLISGDGALGFMGEAHEESSSEEKGLVVRSFGGEGVDSPKGFVDVGGGGKDKESRLVDFVLAAEGDGETEGSSPELRRFVVLRLALLGEELVSMNGFVFKLDDTLWGDTSGDEEAKGFVDGLSSSSEELPKGFDIEQGAKSLRSTEET